MRHITMSNSVIRFCCLIPLASRYTFFKSTAMSSDATTTFLQHLTAGDAAGLEHLSLHNFSDTGRGVKSSSSFRKGDTILTIPNHLLWTQETALLDPIFGPAISSIPESLSIEDTLALYILFVKSRPEASYTVRKLHIELLPKQYTASIFFSDEELAVCEGSSLYAVTLQLRQQIADEYEVLKSGLFAKNPELFPAQAFTLEEVSV